MDTSDHVNMPRDSVMFHNLKDRNEGSFWLEAANSINSNCSSSMSSLLPCEQKPSRWLLLKELMDNKIRYANNLVGFPRLLELAMQCVEESASDRPTMSELVKEIETLLLNEGMQIASTSAASSAIEFGSTKGPGAPRHPYNDPLLRKEENSSGAFDYSGGYTFSVEPK